MNDADDIVDAVLIDGDTGVRGILDRFPYLVLLIIYVDSNHINSRGYDFISADIGEIECGLQQLARILINNALILDGIYDLGKIILGHCVIIGSAPMLRKQPHYLHYDPYYRFEYCMNHRKRNRNIGAEALGITLCNYLRSSLAENEKKYGYAYCGDNCGDILRDDMSIGKEQYEQLRADGGRGQIDEVIADKYASENGIVFIINIERELRPF